MPIIEFAPVLRNISMISLQGQHLLPCKQLYATIGFSVRRNKAKLKELLK